jgi:hypothetical protein
MECMADVVWLMLPIHPNTPAGQTLYNTQITQWNIDNPGLYVSKMQPYPLSPGTAPIMSGECWKCGMIGHTSPSCLSPSPIPALEGCWRSIAGTIKHSCPPTAMLNINYINNKSPWTMKEEHNHQIIADFLDSQGKGQGSSA